MLDFIYGIQLFFFGVVFVGFFVCAVHACRKKLYSSAFFVLVIPFYAVFYILKKMEEGYFKKIAAILVLGGFVVFSIASIIHNLYVNALNPVY